MRRISARLPKATTLLALLLFSSSAFAAKKIQTIPLPMTTYLVEVQLKRDGQVDKSTVTLTEGEDGVVISNGGPESSSSFSAIVHQIGENEVNLSYRVKQLKAGTKLDFARADIAMDPKIPLVVTAQDDQGDDVEIRVSVTKQ